MKVVILAGGFGTRISEETVLKPKPMVEIGGKPIIWHIMKFFSYYGFNEFVILVGYKGHIIKEYFFNYYLHNSNLKIDLETNSIRYENYSEDPWLVDIVDTGLDVMTGGRLLRAQNVIGNSNFFLTYGDGLCDVDLNRVVDASNASGNIVTLTAVRPSGRFGSLELTGSQISSFHEKNESSSKWINGGYMVCNQKIFDFIDSDNCILEESSLPRIAELEGLGAYKHDGFWRCMDTLSDRQALDEIWKSGKAPWKVW